jgi:hypothetical protein
LQEREGEFQQGFGASYELSPRLSVGIELLHEFVFSEGATTKIEIFSSARTSHIAVATGLSRSRLSHKRPTQQMNRSQVRTIFALVYEIETVVDLCCTSLHCQS